MPNHLHIMVVIFPNKSGCTECPPTISAMVKYFKGSITKQLGRNIWQQSFYDHIIRDRADYDEHIRYILENPMRRYFREKANEKSPL